MDIIKLNKPTIDKPFINNIFFHIKNNTYEIYVMWSLLVITILLLLSLLVKDSNDDLETNRIL